MMRIPGYSVATVSGCAQSVLPLDKIEDELRHQINRSMTNLYREGYRRMRTVRLPRTGDAIKYLVMGWPA